MEQGHRRWDRRTRSEALRTHRLRLAPARVWGSLAKSCSYPIILYQKRGPEPVLPACPQEDLTYLEASEDSVTAFYGGGGEDRPLAHFPSLWCPNGTYSTGGQVPPP